MVWSSTAITERVRAYPNEQPRRNYDYFDYGVAAHLGCLVDWLASSSNGVLNDNDYPS